MTHRQPDPNPDSKPRDDDRGSIENVEHPATTETPDAGNGAVGGTDGVTKNQDDDAQ